MAKFQPLTPRLIEKLRHIVGERNVLVGEAERQAYSCDEMCPSERHLPDAVVKPADAREVSSVLSLASEERLPVTPRGAGTGLCGASVPVFGGIVMSLERMDRIKEIDEDNFMAVTEPGVTLKALCQAVEARGLYYPLYPGESSAHIGGNVSTNAGGMKAVRYGVTRNWVLGLEAVLPTGHIVRSGGKLVKCSTAYDLTQLLVGSEGTLAVITEVTLRLTTPPQAREVLFVPFPDLSRAIKAVPQILKLRAPVAGLEFLERDALELMETYREHRIPFSQHEAFILGILEGDSQHEVYRAAGRIADVCTRNGAIDVYIPPSERARKELMEGRENLYHYLKRSGPTEIADVVVPPAQIAEFVARVKEISRRHQIPIVAYGHSGDGNVHLHPMGRDMPKDEWEKKLPRVMKEMYRAGIALGGAISGEHGLGLSKQQYLSMAASPQQIALMRRIKRAFDPHHILNPGKMLGGNAITTQSSRAYLQRAPSSRKSSP